MLFIAVNSSIVDLFASFPFLNKSEILVNSSSALFFKCIYISISSMSLNGLLSIQSINQCQSSVLSLALETTEDFRALARPSLNIGVIFGNESEGDPVWCEYIKEILLAAFLTVLAWLSTEHWALLETVPFGRRFLRSSLHFFIYIIKLVLRFLLRALF